MSSGSGEGNKNSRNALDWEIFYSAHHTDKWDSLLPSACLSFVAPGAQSPGPQSFERALWTAWALLHPHPRCWRSLLGSLEAGQAPRNLHHRPHRYHHHFHALLCETQEAKLVPGRVAWGNTTWSQPYINELITVSGWNTLLNLFDYLTGELCCFLNPGGRAGPKKPSSSLSCLSVLFKRNLLMFCLGEGDSVLKSIVH